MKLALAVITFVPGAVQAGLQQTVWPSRLSKSTFVKMGSRSTLISKSSYSVFQHRSIVLKFAHAFHGSKDGSASNDSPQITELGTHKTKDCFPNRREEGSQENQLLM